MSKNIYQAGDVVNVPYLEFSGLTVVNARWIDGDGNGWLYSLTNAPTPDGTFLAWERQITGVKNYRAMSLSEIAQAIRKDWRNVNFAAKPYLCAMMGLNSVSDQYGYDTGRSVVSYFLCNASTWRGDVAKAIKAELKRRIK